MAALIDLHLHDRVAELYIPSQAALVDPEATERLDALRAIARERLAKFLAGGAWYGAWDPA